MAGHRHPQLKDRRVNAARLAISISLILGSVIFWTCSGDEHHTVTAPVAPLRFIDSTYPADGAFDVPVNSSIVIQFLRPMDRSTMIGRKFYFSGGHLYSFSADSMRAVISPSRMRYCAGYQVIIDSGLVDRDSNVMTRPYSFTFQTETGNELISTVFPLNHATDVPLDAVISVTFTKDMDSSTIHNGTFFVDGLVPGAVGYSHRSATITPADSLEPHRIYTVTLKSSISDTSGTPLGEDYVWSFTTVQVNPIYVVSEFPADGDTLVPAYTDISITFSKAIDPFSVTQDEFTVGGVSGRVGAFIQTIRFVPDENLQFEKTYLARFAGEVSDMAGNVAQIDHEWSFRTAPRDTLPPQLISVYPEDGFEFAPTNTNIRMTFSETIDPSAISGDEFTLVDNDSNSVPGVTGVIDSIVYFDPDYLRVNRIYTVVFDGEVKDMEGNVTTLVLQWSFQTKRPQVVSRYPEISQGCIPLDAQIILQCSGEVDPATVSPDDFLFTIQDGDTLTGSVTVDGKSIIYTPDIPLEALSTYRMYVYGSIKDTLGNDIYIPGQAWYFTTKGENLLPLAVGNIWRYNVYMYEGMLVRSPSAARIDSIYIVGDTLIEGKRYFRDQRGDLYRYENDVIETNFKSMSYSGHILREFENLNCDNSGAISIDTDLGEFTCQYFRLYFNIGYFYNQSYNFAPDIGLVRFDQKRQPPSSDPAKYEIWLLIDYNIR